MAFIKDYETILAISGSRNCTISSISGSRNMRYPFPQILDPEIEVFQQFLDPEIAAFHQFLDPEDKWSILPISGSRN